MPMMNDKEAKGFEHKGLEAVANIDVDRVRRTHGEQFAIELISKLISGRARTSAQVDAILSEGGLF